MAGNKLGHNGYDFYSSKDAPIQFTLLVDENTKVEGTAKQIIRFLLNKI